MTVTSTFEQDYLKIYFDDTVHLSFYVGNCIGFQSWVESKSWYYVTIYFERCKISCKYDNFQLWQDILRELNEYL